MSEYHGESGIKGLARNIYDRIFLCPRGKHSRSFASVRPEGERYVAKCRGCGAPMVRLSKRNWVVDTRS